jgi:hypothetical protein
MRKNYLAAAEQMKVLGHLSEGAAQPELIKWFTQQAGILKGRITEDKRHPIKTVCRLYSVRVVNGIHEYWGIAEARSRISKEDALRCLHSKELGRKAAIRNLFEKLREEGYSKEFRAELAKQILPMKKG